MTRQIVNVGPRFEVDLNVDRLPSFILQRSKYGVRVGIAVHVYAYSLSADQRVAGEFATCPSRYTQPAGRPRGQQVRNQSPRAHGSHRTNDFMSGIDGTNINRRPVKASGTSDLT